LNNIIVTLPSNTRFTNEAGNSINFKHLKPGSPVSIQIPNNPNNIGIIDGQHRVFSYHEGDDAYESDIRLLREKQHLLVTAVIYPSLLSEGKRDNFEAKLFLEINDKQTKVKSSLKHVIYTAVYPYSDIAIAKRVVQQLSRQNPMDEVFERNNFEKGRLSTTSVVSYGLLYLVKPDGVESLFRIWTGRNKQKLLARNNKKVTEEYIVFCSKEIRDFLAAFKANIRPDMWTTKQKISKVLTATTINGLIHCMRLLVRDSKTGDFDYYKDKFRNIDSKIDFSTQNFQYKSSHWKDLGEQIYKVCFD
jgi:DGQHR domain-containing protein